MKNISDKYINEMLEAVKECYSVYDDRAEAAAKKINDLCRQYLGEDAGENFYCKIEDLESQMMNYIEQNAFAHGFKTGVRIVLAALDKLVEEHREE